MNPIDLIIVLLVCYFIYQEWRNRSTTAQRTGRWRIRVGVEPDTEEESMLTVECPISAAKPRRVRVHFTPTDDDGNPAGLDGPVKAEVVDGVGTAEVDAGGDVLIRPAGAVETQTCSVKVSGDADLGEGVVPLEDVITVSWTHLRAQNLGASVVVEEDVIA